MQTNFNPHSQQFGMAFHTNANVNKAIKSRIKTAKELEKLENLIQRESVNDKVDITLLVNPDGKTLSGNVYSTNSKGEFYKQFSENAFSRLFNGPVKFLEKLADVADKAAAKLEKESFKHDDTIDKMFQ